jgi:formiminotetrahydrofolate cyclodeaminase
VPDQTSIDTVWGLRLDDFRDRVASAAPTPGGGSVSIVSGVLGLGLVMMALEISCARAADPQLTQMRDALERARVLLKTLSGRADEDIAVFDAYMAAAKLPRADAGQAEIRKAQMQRTLVAAARLPLVAGEELVRGLEIAAAAASDVNRNIISDVAAGAILMVGAARAVLLNVDINLRYLSSDEEKHAIATARASIAEMSERHFEAVQSAIDKRGS